MGTFYSDWLENGMFTLARLTGEDGVLKNGRKARATARGEHGGLLFEV